MEPTGIISFVINNYIEVIIGSLVAYLTWKITRRDKETKEENKEKKEFDNKILTALDNVEKKVVGVDHKLDLSNKDITTLVKGQDKQSETNKRIFTEMGNMREDISKLQTDVEHLKDEKVK